MTTAPTTTDGPPNRPTRRRPTRRRRIVCTHERTGGLHLALWEAAASDTDLARQLRESEQRHRVDVTRASEWSHECHRVTWLDGVTAAAPGVRFRGRNQSGWRRWSRVCEITAVDAPRTIEWRTIATRCLPTAPTGVSLDPIDTRTRIVQTYQLTRMPRWYNWLLVRMSPMHLDRSGALTDDLRRIGTIAAGDTHGLELAG